MSPKRNELREAFDRLDAWFAACPAAAVALSGGVDSSLVTFLARRSLGASGATAYVADSPSLKRRDLGAAIEFCAQYEIPLVVLQTNELGDADYVANPADRCYFCKSGLYAEMDVLLPNDGSVWTLNGTNIDDLGDYRPGLSAARENRVRSPLAECGIDKATVRTLARHFNLVCWDKPASPCLSSRIPYGESVTAAKLARIEAGEERLEALGFDVVRVRHHQDRAVIEVAPERLERLRDELPGIEAEFSRLGFPRVEIDIEGFVSGKLNRLLMKP